MSTQVPSKHAVSRRGNALHGTMTVPGDKSISHRALMLGALTVGTTTIEGLLEGGDVLATAQAMRSLGARVVRVGMGQWHVDGLGVGGLLEPEDVLDMGNAGTAARLILGMLATHPVTATITGDASLRRRPMGRVMTPLGQTGAAMTARDGNYLPLTVRGVAMGPPLDYTLPVASAQVKSAVLLAGLNLRGTTVVREPEPTRDHSERMLKAFGAAVTVEAEGEGRVIRLVGEPELRPTHVSVPRDPSSAAFPMVAAALVPGSEVTLPSVGLNPLRTGLFETLREMGADLTVTNARDQAGEPVGDVIIKGSALKGVDVPAVRAPSMIDEYPILAVACACAEGSSRLRGLAELRVKESNRLDGMAQGLAACGVDVRVEGDDLLIHGTGAPPAGGAVISSNLDHRIAMAFLILGLVSAKPITVRDVATVDTSFPGFIAGMAALGAAMTPLADEDMT